MSNSNQYPVLCEIEKKTGITYDPDRRILEFPDSGTDVDHYTALFEYLIDKGFITKQDAPISSQDSQFRHILNTEPKHEEGEMVRPREVGGKFYIETNNDTKSKKRYSIRVIEEFVQY